jgi:NADPH2:quinone reductase
VKAILCSEWGPFDQLVLGERPSPSPGANQLRIQVHACGVNFADTLIVQGKYQDRPDFPFSPGLEVAGIVVETGNDVSAFRPGDRVLALCPYGGYAEEVLAPAATALPLPESIDFIAAAGFMVAYGTAHLALTERAALQAGETLLVHAAAGGVGLAAVEIGSQLSATVIGTASSEEKLALAREHGAAHTINYLEAGFKDRVRALTGGRGADVIFDPVGGSVFEESLRAAAWGARLLVIGFASGEVAQAATNLVLVKNLSVIGLYWGGYADRDPAVLTDSLRELLDWWLQGRLRPLISKVYPLAEAAQALSDLAGRHSIGKLVIQVREA